MRILQIISSMDPRLGGPSEGIRQIIPVLDSEGHTTEIACVDSPTDPWVLESCCPIHALGPARGIYSYTSRLSPWLASRSHEFDCAIVHGVWQYAGLGTWRAMRHSTTPYFVFPHGMLDPWFRKNNFLKHLKKSVYWKIAESRVLRDARAVLYTCEEEKIQAARSFRPYQCNGVTVKYGTAGPTGDAENQRRAFQEKFPELEGKRFLLFLGRIHFKKGCDILVEAFAQVAGADPELMLVMAGPDDSGWTSELRGRANDRGIGHRVLWPGMVKGDLKWGLLRETDAFILPSHQENFGIAVAEALACGTPVLISDKVNIWREIQTDGAGIVGSDDWDGTVLSLRRWIDLPSHSKEEMGERAMRCFLDRFHIQQAARSLIEVLKGNSAFG